LIQAPE
jgi:hypothetical protein